MSRLPPTHSPLSKPSLARRSELRPIRLLSWALTIVLTGAAITLYGASPALPPSLLLPPSPAPPAPSPPRAATRPELPPAIQKLVEALNSQQFTTREEATYALLHLPANRRSDIEAALAQSADPEVIARLTHVALHLFLKSLTPLEGKAGLLGIALNIEPIRLGKKDSDLHMAVAVSETQLGFPAAEQLRCGDRLVALNGHPFSLDLTIDEFRQTIMTQTPGTTLNFTVFRAGHQIDVPVQLAGLDDAGFTNIAEYVLKRNLTAQQYLKTIVTGVKTSTNLHIKDDSPLPDQTRIRIEDPR